MLYDLLQGSAKKYMGKPFPFIYVALMRLFSVFITGFAALAIIFLLILALTTFNVMNAYGLVATLVVSIAAFLFFAYFWAAYKGAMIKAFMNAEISAVHLHDYLDYAIENAPRYFTIFVVKNLFLFIINLPMTILFAVLKPDLGSAVGIVLIILTLLVSFAGKFVFSFVYIAAAVKDLAPADAIKNGLRFVRKNAARAFAVYCIYSFVWVMLLIPVLNIFVLASLYPIMYLVMINFYRSKSF